MNQPFPELDEVRVTVDPATRDRQLAAINHALAESGSPRRLRRRLFAVALAVLLVLPVLAAAAQDAVPGDFLYPVKQAFEPVISLFDDDYVAQRRVTELEEMIERDLPHQVISDHVDDARLRVTDERQDLAARIDSVVDQLEGTKDVVEDVNEVDDDVDLNRLDSDESNSRSDATTGSTHLDDSDETNRDTTDETRRRDDSTGGDSGDGR